MRELLFVLALFLATARAFGSQNIEADNFQTMLDQAKRLCAIYRQPTDRGCESVLAGFDVDNTLLNPPTIDQATQKLQELGSDEWFTWQAQLLTPGMPVSPMAVAGDMGSLLGIDALLLSRMSEQVVDPEAPRVLGTLQSLGIPSIVITARGPLLRETTETQLRANGYDFTRSPLAGSVVMPGGPFPQGTFAPYDPANPEKSGLRAPELAGLKLAVAPAQPLPVSYQNGIFMVNGQHKGAMLRTLLANTRARMPRAIVYIDDTPAQVQRMQAAFAGSGIDVVTIQFTKTYPRVVEFFEGDKADLAAQGQGFVRSLTPQIRQQMGIR